MIDCGLCSFAVLLFILFATFGFLCVYFRIGLFDSWVLSFNVYWLIICCASCFALAYFELWVLDVCINILACLC